MGMKMEVSPTSKRPALPIESNRVRLVAEDGHVAFEIMIGADGRSVEVRGVDSFTVNHVLYSNALEIRASGSNKVTIRAQAYDDN